MSTPKTKPTLEDVHEGIFNMEAPLLNLRGLAYAIHTLASSDETPKRQLSAISAVADMMLMELDSMIDEREILWGLSVVHARMMAQPGGADGGAA